MVPSSRIWRRRFITSGCRFGELAAFLVTDVAGRRADEAARSELLHVLGHVDLDEGVGVAEHELREVSREECLTHTGGPEEDEGTDGPLGILEVGARTAQGLRDRDHGFVLAADLLLELFFHLEKPLGFFLFHALQRDAGPLGDDRHDVFLGDIDALLLVVGPPLVEEGVELLLRLLLLVTKRGGFFEILFLDGGFLAADDLFDLGFDVFDLGRPGHRGDAGARAGLVHDVDGLVGKESAGEVALGKADAGLDGGVGELRIVVDLVLGTEPLENQDGVLDVGLLDLDGLEAALEGGVLLDVLAVLVHRRRPDALELAAGKSGLDDVGGVHGALCGAGSHNGVELVDEENDVLGAPDLVHDGLDALLELAAVLGAGDHEGEVQGDDLLVAKELGNAARGNFLGEALDDGGFADTGFADEDGVVLGAAAENLDHALDLLVAADHGVELVFLGELGKVAAEGAQSGSLGVFLAAGGGCAFFEFALLEIFGREVGVELAKDLVAGALDVDLEALEDAGGHALAFAEKAEKNVLGADV
jgi:hypothetical protein